MHPLQILIDCTETGRVCGWEEFIGLINQLVQFAVYLSVTCATLGFAWAGWLYLTSGGNSSSVSKAREIMWNSVLGIIIVLVAWLVVQFVLKTLGYVGPSALG